MYWILWKYNLNFVATLQIDCGDKTVGTTEKAGIEKCNAAFTILKDICNQIKYGTISIEMCKMLCEKQHNQQLKLLFYVIKTKYNAPEDLMVQLFELHDQVCRYEVYKENIQVVILACEDIFSGKMKSVSIGKLLNFNVNYKV